MSTKGLSNQSPKSKGNNGMISSVITSKKKDRNSQSGFGVVALVLGVIALLAVMSYIITTTMQTYGTASQNIAERADKGTTLARGQKLVAASSQKGVFVDPQTGQEIGPVRYITPDMLVAVGDPATNPHYPKSADGKGYVKLANAPGSAMPMKDANGNEVYVMALAPALDDYHLGEKADFYVVPKDNNADLQNQAAYVLSIGDTGPAADEVAGNLVTEIPSNPNTRPVSVAELDLDIRQSGGLLLQEPEVAAAEEGECVGGDASTWPLDLSTTSPVKILFNALADQFNCMFENDPRFIAAVGMTGETSTNVGIPGDDSLTGKKLVWNPDLEVTYYSRSYDAEAGNQGDPGFGVPDPQDPEAQSIFTGGFEYVSEDDPKVTGFANSIDALLGDLASANSETAEVNPDAGAACTAGQKLTFDGSQFVCAEDLVGGAGAGDITMLGLDQSNSGTKLATLAQQNIMDEGELVGREYTLDLKTLAEGSGIDITESGGVVTISSSVNGITGADGVNLGGGDASQVGLVYAGNVDENTLGFRRIQSADSFVNVSTNTSASPEHVQIDFDIDDFIANGLEVPECGPGEKLMYGVPPAGTQASLQFDNNRAGLILAQAVGSRVGDGGKSVTVPITPKDDKRDDKDKDDGKITGDSKETNTGSSLTGDSSNSSIRGSDNGGKGASGDESSGFGNTVIRQGNGSGGSSSSGSNVGDGGDVGAGTGAARFYCADDDNEDPRYSDDIAGLSCNAATQKLVYTGGRFQCVADFQGVSCPVGQVLSAVNANNSGSCVPMPTASFWVSVPNGIMYNAGNIGVQTTPDATHALNVGGDIMTSGDVMIEGDPNMSLSQILSCGDVGQIYDASTRSCVAIEQNAYNYGYGQQGGPKDSFVRANIAFDAEDGDPNSNGIALFIEGPRGSGFGREEYGFASDTETDRYTDVSPGWWHVTVTGVHVGREVGLKFIGIGGLNADPADPRFGQCRRIVNASASSSDYKPFSMSTLLKVDNNSRRIEIRGASTNLDCQTLGHTNTSVLIQEVTAYKIGDLN